MLKILLNFTKFGLEDLIILLLLVAVLSALVLMYVSFKKQNQFLLNLIVKGIVLDVDTDSVIELSIRIWSLKNIMLMNDNENTNKIHRQFERIERVLKTKYGLEINDYTGRIYNNINVVVSSILPDDKIDKKIIYKTLSPEIRINGMLVKKSHVEIHEPVLKEEDSSIEFPLDQKQDQTDKLNHKHVNIDSENEEALDLSNTMQDK